MKTVDASLFVEMALPCVLLIVVDTFGMMPVYVLPIIVNGSFFVDMLHLDVLLIVAGARLQPNA